MGKEGEWPPGAIAWKTSREKGTLTRQWRRANMAKYGDQSRQLTPLWALENLTSLYGYATAGDGELAKETGLPPKSVQSGLMVLDRDGAIVRVHVPKNGNLECR